MNVKSTVLTVGPLLLMASHSFATTASISKDEAEKKALAAYSGKVKEVEDEKYHGEPVFSFEVKGKEGVHEIIIRKSDGKILKNAADKDDEDDDED